ncbi:glycoside hydrolase family 16 protein [Persicobacter psychrovividus]|uniref:GH16 domain-containing protein n=1 Tax=Persicobacter psychrovividus TaxID=387638 RepID=A0ABM7VMP5_9BACT|nr:hypothetical protein PEPS_45650 [Persicobacter psychrovividus]
MRIIVLIWLVILTSGAFAQTPIEISPANGWHLSWSDEFDYENEQLDQKWESQNGPSSHILCSRWRENAVVGDGVLELEARKEKKAGQEWTAGNIWTKKKFKYGYFECRYKYAGAGATNNSFWLMTKGPAPKKGERFEIDINEGHFPNSVNTNIHNWGKKHTSDSRSHVFGITADVNLPLEIPITTNKIRFSSRNNGHFHLREFRIYNDNHRNFPDVFSETADQDVQGLINYARQANTKVRVSGKFDENHPATNMTDGKVLGSSWVSQKAGEKWVEFEFDKKKTVGCVQFINGWRHGEHWAGLISDYKIEYWNGHEWVEMASLDLVKQNNFSENYHTYGLKWDEKELVFYFDGKEIRREKNEFCFSEAPIWLSLAIIKWNGPVKDVIDGKSMKVDYVRYYTNEQHINH